MDRNIKWNQQINELRMAKKEAGKKTIENMGKNVVFSIQLQQISYYLKATMETQTISVRKPTLTVL